MEMQYTKEELESGIRTVTKDDFYTVINGAVPIRKWDSIVLHHSYKPDLPVEGVDYAKVFNAYHLEACGWLRGLGYQFVITWNVKNPELPIKIQSSWRWMYQTVGAHSLNRKRKDLGINPNQTSIGVCVVGNFDIYTLPIPVYSQIKEFIDEIKKRYGITNDRIFGHYQFEYKTCPGKKFDIKAISGY